MKTVVWNLMLAAVVAFAGIGEAAAKGPRLGLDVSPANGVLKAGEKQTTFVRVGLDGFKLEREKQRPPVNLAIVLDKSGSMQGHKIEQARKAAIDAIGLLGPNDIVSVVTYDSTVSVVVPATKLTDKQSVIARIRRCLRVSRRVPARFASSSIANMSTGSFCCPTVWRTKGHHLQASWRRSEPRC